VFEVLLGGLLAIAGKWLLDGGLRRARRAEIKELLELAAMSKQATHFVDLHLMASAKLDSYTKPSWYERLGRPTWKSAPWWMVGLAVSAVLVPASIGVWFASGGRVDAPTSASLLGTVAVATATTGALSSLEARWRRRREYRQVQEELEKLYRKAKKDAAEAQETADRVTAEVDDLLGRIGDTETDFAQAYRDQVEGKPGSDGP